MKTSSRVAIASAAGAIALAGVAPLALAQTSTSTDTAASTVSSQTSSTSPSLVAGAATTTVHYTDGVKAADAAAESTVVQGTVWADVNGNGTRDEGDFGIAKISVTLLDSNGDRVAETVTDDQGHYKFEGVASGEHRVVVIPMHGTGFTKQGVGDDKTKDSDVADNGNATVATDQDATVDAGLVSKNGEPIPSENPGAEETSDTSGSNTSNTSGSNTSSDTSGAPVESSGSQTSGSSKPSTSGASTSSSSTSGASSSVPTSASAVADDGAVYGPKSETGGDVEPESFWNKVVSIFQ